jgi:hypothetical protein
MTAFGIRFFLIERLKLKNPFNYTSDNDIKFSDVYLNYLAQLKFDDMFHWTEK